MQAFDFDYCDTYESYGSSGVMLENNGVRMFTCGECKGQKTFVKKIFFPPFPPFFYVFYQKF